MNIWQRRGFQEDSANCESGTGVIVPLFSKNGAGKLFHKKYSDKFTRPIEGAAAMVSL